MILCSAGAAVNTSLSWENFGPEQHIMAKSGELNVPILNDELETISYSVTVDASDSFESETVAVYVNIIHGSRGDLQVGIPWSDEKPLAFGY